MKKYSKLLDTPYQKEMVSDIEKELKSYYSEMQENEIKLMSKEIYVVCILMCNNIDLLTIIQFLQFLDNNYYFGIEKGKGGMIESAITDNTAIHLKTIVNKYMKEIQEKECNDKL